MRPTGTFAAIYDFETHLTPAKVFQALAKEQTTTGFHTLSRQFGDCRYQAQVSNLEIAESTGADCYQGRVTIQFPVANLSNASPIEDILCFALGETHHLAGIHYLKLVDLELPRDVLRELPGPRYGVIGLRSANSIPKRPFLMGPLRPEVGLTPEEYGAVTYEALLGGADIVKDDELIVDPTYSPFEHRVRACVRAARKAEDVVGERKMYIPNLGADLRVLEKRLQQAVDLGADAIMLHPRLTPSALLVARSKVAIPIVSHYEILSTVTIHARPAVRFGLMLSLYRLCGADIITFPRPNQRFDIPSEDFADCFSACLRSDVPCKHAMPAPTGGAIRSSIDEMKTVAGCDDFVFVSGSALFEHPNGIRAGAAELRHAIANS